MLKDRIVELEGAIMRWRHVLDTHPEPADALGDAADAMAAPFSSRETWEDSHAEQLAVEVADLRQKVLGAEEAASLARSQLEHALDRGEAMRQVAEHLRREDREEKANSMQQLSRQRLSMEERYAAEIRDLRLTYEAQRSSLERELTQVAEAIRREVGGGSALAVPDDEPEGTEESYDEGGPRGGNRRHQTDPQASGDARRSAAAWLDRVAPPAPPPPPPDYSAASVDAESQTEQSSRAAEEKSAGEGDQEGSQAESGRRAKPKPPTTKKAKALAKELAETKKSLAAALSRLETSNSQVQELEHLLEAQKPAFALSRFSNTDTKSRSSLSAPTDDQVRETRQLNARFKESVGIHGDDADAAAAAADSLRHDERSSADGLAGEVVNRLKRLYSKACDLVGDDLSLDSSGVLALEAKAKAYSNEILSLISLSEKVKIMCASPTFEEAGIGAAEPYRAAAHNDSSDRTAEALVKLTDRVKSMEDAFESDRSLPERHLLLIRELRARTSNLESLHRAEVTAHSEQWDAERGGLRKRITALERELRLAEQAKARCETSVKDAEAALEFQAASATEQIKQMQGVMAAERQRFADAMARFASTEEKRAGESKEQQAGDDVSHLKERLSIAESEVSVFVASSTV